MEEHIYIDELTNILLKTGALNPEAAKGLDEIFQESRHESFEQFLLEESFVDKGQLLEALSMLYSVPAIDADGIFFETFLLKKFPKGVLMRNAIIPFKQDENMLIVVAADPSNEALLDIIGQEVSYDIQFYVGIYADILEAIQEYYDKSLTEVVDEDERLRIRDLDDIPGKQEDRDASAFIKERINEFTRRETQQEKEEIEQRAHNLKLHKKKS